MSDLAFYTTREIVIPAGTMVGKMAMTCFDVMEPVEFAMVDIGRFTDAEESGVIAQAQDAAA